jgi:hypothetical protein
MPLKPRWTEGASRQNNCSGRRLLMELVERPLRGIGAIEKPTSIILTLIRSGPKALPPQADAVRRPEIGTFRNEPEVGRPDLASERLPSEASAVRNNRECRHTEYA